MSVVYVAITVVTLLDILKPPVSTNKRLHLIAVLGTTLIIFVGYHTFKATWTTFSMVAILADRLHVSISTLLTFVGLLGCVVGFYAVYTFSCRIIILGSQLPYKLLSPQARAEISANLKQNWFFPISATAFFFLFSTQSVVLIQNLFITACSALVVASYIPAIYKLSFKTNLFTCVVSALSTVGLCLAAQDKFCSYWKIFYGTSDKLIYVSIFCAFIAVFFVYSCILLFWEEMRKIISDNSIFDDINVPERIIYGILIVGAVALMFFSFTQSEAFYGTNYDYDIIYSSDSPSLVRDNVYLDLMHGENDLRQPLFAVFSAPFTGMPYLIGRLLGASASSEAMLLNTVQIIMLFAANFMLTKIMKLSPVKRVCFMILTSCTYTHLLFTLMMEQYIVAYFWAIFCIYLISQNQRSHRIVLWGAGGTLLTSMILMPLMSDANPIRNFKKWFVDMIKFGLEFVAVLLLFFRFDILFNLISSITALSRYTGKSITFADKLYQYITFVSTYFFAPDAAINPTAEAYISWQLNPVTNISLIGVVILLLVVISVIINRDKMSSLLAAGWIVLSIVMLLGLGWGTAENGLILYELYFGWAFLVLLFQLVEKIEDRLNVNFLVPVFSIGSAVILAVINIPAIMEMVYFAITYYPV